MSDRATMLRETEEVFAELRGMFNWLSEEQASRTGDSILKARSYWAPDSYWGRRYPGKRDA